MKAQKAMQEAVTVVGRGLFEEGEKGEAYLRRAKRASLLFVAQFGSAAVCGNLGNRYSADLRHSET